MSKAYKTFPFALSMVIAEMPYSILCAVFFFIPLYYIPGLNSSSSRAGYQFFMVLITEVFSVTLGQAVAALTPTPFIASYVNPFVSAFTSSCFQDMLIRTDHHYLRSILWCHHSQATNPQVLACMAVRTQPLHPPHRRYGRYRTPQLTCRLLIWRIQPVPGSRRSGLWNIHGRLLQPRRARLPFGQCDQRM
jgi:hypothetical protein